MGCGSSNSTQTVREGEAPQEPEKEQIDTPDEEPDYPPPKPANQKKAAIFDIRKCTAIDDHARKTPDSDMDTYEKLIDYLTGDYKSNLQKVRAIFTWIGSQRIAKANFKTETGTSTPRGFMKLIQERKCSYAAFFVTLCRKAGIPAVLINGVSKSAGYEVGDQDVSGMRNKWTAVYVNDSWRFVHPLWAFSVIVGHSTGNWTLVESGGQGVRQEESASSGTTLTVVDENYFLTDAEVFVAECFPDSEKWQLLRQPYTMQKFVNIPQYEPEFFQHNVKLRSEEQAILNAKDGQIEVDVKVPDKFITTYRLYYNHKLSHQQISSSIQLEKYVFMENTETKTAFKFRFPVSGIYKAIILGALANSDTITGLLSVRIDCETAKKNCQPLPDNPVIGWGPGPRTENCGLVDPTQKSGLIITRPLQECAINFDLTKSLLFRTELKSNGIASERLANCVHQSVRTNHLDIGVTVPAAGEYALKIWAKEKGSSGGYQNVCNYMVTTENDKKSKREFENAAEKKARQDMNSAAKQRDTQNLKQSIDKFVIKGLDDNGDYSKAAERLDYLTLRKNLTDGINRRHLRVLDKAIKDAEESRFVDQLQAQLHDARELREHLLRVDRFSHAILDLKQTTISEIHRYKKPMPPTYEVMMATYLLLGEKPHHIQEWEDIQALMKKTAKQGLMRRVKQFDTVNVQPETAETVQNLLNKYDEQSARQVSAGVATFYVWARGISAEVLKNSQSQDQVKGQGHKGGGQSKKSKHNQQGGESQGQHANQGIQNKDQLGTRRY